MLGSWQEVVAIMQPAQTFNLSVVGLPMSALVDMTYLDGALSHLLLLELALFTTLVAYVLGFGPNIGGVVLGVVEATFYAW